MNRFRGLAETVAELEQGNPPPADSGFLGSQLDPKLAELVILPVPWEATTSYGRGTAQGSRAVVQASHQLDLEDPYFGPVYRQGIASLEVQPELEQLNESACRAAIRVIQRIERGEVATTDEDLEQVNHLSLQLNERVHRLASAWLDRNKRVGLLGGDHSSPFGLLQALAERHPDGFGVLHLDAHHDLREAYEGFIWSHASIFHNVLTRLPQVISLVQYGIRDFSRAESRFASEQGARVRCWYDADRYRYLASGKPLVGLLEQVIESLPEKVYISFDIDGLDPSLCPSTGTPVPGGPGFNEVVLLLECLASSGRQIIGFDLCEVAPDQQGGEWDANVGARILYKLCGATLHAATGSRSP